MPSHQGVGRNDRGKVGENLPSQAIRLGRQSSTLIVAESQPLIAELLAKNPVLLTKVVNRNRQSNYRGDKRDSKRRDYRVRAAQAWGVNCASR